MAADLGVNDIGNLKERKEDSPPSPYPLRQERECLRNCREDPTPITTRDRFSRSLIVAAESCNVSVLLTPSRQGWRAGANCGDVRTAVPPSKPWVSVRPHG